MFVLVCDTQSQSKFASFVHFSNRVYIEYNKRSNLISPFVDLDLPSIMFYGSVMTPGYQCDVIRSSFSKNSK